MDLFSKVLSAPVIVESSDGQRILKTEDAKTIAYLDVPHQEKETASKTMIYHESVIKAFDCVLGREVEIKVNVLLLHSFADSDQSIRQIVSLGTELRKQGIYPSLLLLNLEKENSLKYKKLLTDLRYDVTVVNDKKEITALFLEFKFDLIHAHSFLVFNLAQELSSFYELPYVLTVKKGDINRKLPEVSLQRAKAIICLEPSITGNFAEYQEKVHVILEGIDTDKYSLLKKGNAVKIFYR